MHASPIPVSLSWSGGKDSAFALFHLLQDPRYEVRRLHTTFGEQTRRVGMHGIAEELIDLQAEFLELPLDKIYYPASGDNRAYEKAIHSYLDQLEAAGISQLAYGDIFLEDLRAYREQQLASRGFSAVFPLWEKPTGELAIEFVKTGFKTLICAADADLISKERVGRDFDRSFLEGLAKGVDPCGENGEFHSFCYDGPIFSRPLPINVGEIVEQSYDILLANGERGKKRFWFADISATAQ